MMIHQDGSRHEWAAGQMWDLIVTMDDATSEHYSMFFVAEEGTVSSMRGVYEVIAGHGLFNSFYSDRGSHYWHTPQAGGKVDKDNPTQFGRAMKQLGVDMIAAYSPEARGRSERAFGTPRVGFHKNWRSQASRTWRRPIDIWRPSICRPDAEFLNRRWRRVPRLFRGSAAAWKISCASSTTESWVPTTVSSSRASRYRYRRIAIAVTTSR